MKKKKKKKMLHVLGSIWIYETISLTLISMHKLCKLHIIIWYCDQTVVLFCFVCGQCVLFPQLFAVDAILSDCNKSGFDQTNELNKGNAYHLSILQIQRGIVRSLPSFCWVEIFQF